SGIPIRWYSELFYINRATLLIKTSGVTLSREMAEVDYSVEYSIHIATREDAIRILQRMPNESHTLILRDIHALAGPTIKQVVTRILHVTPLELVNTITPGISQLIHQQLQSFLSNYGITLDGVQVLVASRDERLSGPPSFEGKSQNVFRPFELERLGSHIN